MAEHEVYKAIAAIIGEMSQEGISKDSTNQQQRWNFRGIDAVYNALAPKLAKYELMILTRVLNRTCTDRLTKSGGNMFYVVVDCEFDFVSAKDGSKHTVRIFGEAMDSGDKATNKAMSIALKYAAFQTFFIPTEATTQDPDFNSNEFIKKPELESIGKDQESAITSWKDKGYTTEQCILAFETKYEVSASIKQIIKETYEGV